MINVEELYRIILYNLIVLSQIIILEPKSVYSYVQEE
jgi:hypothetical protein